MRKMKTIITGFIIVLMLATVSFGFVSRPLSGRLLNSVIAYPGDDLQDAYDFLTSSDRDAEEAMGTIGVLNQRTLILTSGSYTSTSLILDTNYANIQGLGHVTITDTSGAVINCGSVIARISGIRIDADSIANALTNDATITTHSVTVTDGTDIQVLVDGLSGAFTLDQTNSLFSWGTNFFEMGEISDPGAGAANIGRFYVRDAGGSVSIPYFQDAAGTETSMIGGAGATSLDAAYNTGSTIDVDADPIVATVSNTDNNRVLDLVQNDITNNPAAFKVTNAGTGICIDVDGPVDGGGTNWEGSNGSSIILGTGAGTFTGLTTTSLPSLFGDGTNTVAVNSSVWDIATTGAASGFTTFGLSGDLTSSAGDIILADTKVLKGSVTITDTIGMSAYDVDGGAYVQVIKLTNANTITTEIGTNVETIAIDSTTWDVSAAGVFSGLTGLTLASGVVNLNVSSNFAVNIATGTSTGTISAGTGAGIQTIDLGTGGAAKTVTLGSQNSTSTTDIDSGSGGVNINASNNQPTNLNTGNSTGTTAIGNALSDVTIAGHIQGATALIFDGASDDDNEVTIAVTDPTADITWTFPDGGADTLAFMGSTLATNYPEVANSVTGGTNQLVFEGSDADTEETIITATDPTADIIWTLADGGAQTVAFMPSTLATNFVDIVNSVWGGTNQLIFEGTDADTEETVITVADATADNTFTFGDDSGSVTYTPTGKTTKDASDAALPLTHAIIEGTSSGASAWSLANGENGQILTVQIVTDGGEATITPATSTGWATAVLTDDIDGISMMYIDDTVGWIVLGTFSDGTNIVALTQ